MNDLKWLLSSDQHIPYHNKRYIDLYFQVQKWFQPDVVDILGDLDDANACSRFSDGKPDEVLNASALYAVDVQNFFKDTRDISPDAQIHFATGNHEMRYDDYIDKKAPALKGLITPEVLWKTDTYGVTLSYYNNPPVHRFGDVYAHHGMAISQHAGESVRKDIENFGVSIIRGHSHRQGTYFKTFDLTGQEWRGYELGHLTDIRSEGMAYAQQKNWQAGFGIAHIVSGYPHIQLIKIKDYECVVDGHVFRA